MQQILEVDTVRGGRCCWLLVVWLSGCLVVWSFGCLVVWLWLVVVGGCWWFLLFGRLLDGCVWSQKISDATSVTDTNLHEFITRVMSSPNIITTSSHVGLVKESPDFLVRAARPGLKLGTLLHSA